MTLAMAISPNLVAAAFAAEMLGVNHKDLYGHHPFLNHRRIPVSLTDVKRVFAVYAVKEPFHAISQYPHNISRLFQGLGLIYGKP